MKYGKIMGDVLLFAPNPIVLGETRIGNPPAAVYEAQGYKPLQKTPFPVETPEPGFRWESRWEETDDCILQGWVPAAIPADEELSGEEALNILLGGENP